MHIHSWISWNNLRSPRGWALEAQWKTTRFWIRRSGSASPSWWDTESFALSGPQFLILIITWTSRSCGLRMPPAISVNEGCCGHQPLQPPLMVSPEGTEDGNRIPTIKQSGTTASPQRCTLRGLRMGKHRTLAPESWGAYQRNDFNEPRLLNLPIHRKA